MDEDDRYDAYIEASTDWDRIRFHSTGKSGSMSAAELRKPCERLGCTCRWSHAPAGAAVMARNLPGTVTAYPADWQPFPGWVPVQYLTGLSLTRISDITLLEV